MMPHYSFKSLEQSKSFIVSDHACTSVRGDLLPEIILSWKSHYLSWKNFYLKNSNLGLILRFEDLINNTEKTLYLALDFLCKKINQNIDRKKFINCLNSINFNNLQKFEAMSPFPESVNIKQKFFRKGIVDEWKINVPQKIIKEIEKNFYNEMKELNYL